MKNDQRHPSNPADSKINPQDTWYKNPMVWMIIALPLIVVIASMVTINIAHKNAPAIVPSQNAEEPVISTDSKTDHSIPK